MQHPLTGQLDMDTCGELAKKLTPLLQSSTTLTLDFTAIGGADSAALALILELQRNAEFKGAELQLTGLSSELTSLAALYGIEDLLMPLVKVTT